MHDLLRKLGGRFHEPDHVDDLELALFGFLDRLLSGDHDQREAAELRVGGRGHEVGGAGAERRHADAGASGQPPVCRGHEPGTLLVAVKDDTYARLSE